MAINFFLKRLEKSRYLISRDEGSLTPLALGFFFISLIMIFSSINLLHGYLERRHLILVLEGSLQVASQSIDDFSYYRGYVGRNTELGGARNKTTFIPIDCEVAREIFFQEFSSQWFLSQVNNGVDITDLKPSFLSGKESSSSNLRFQKSIPRILSFQCDGRTLQSKAALDIYLPFPVKFAGVDLMEFSTQEVLVEVGSIWGG
jgi:hypothetical protein